MSVIRGRVLQISDQHVTVLTEDCQYLKLARPGGQLRIGAEIEVGLSAPSKIKAFVRASAFSLAAALVIILILPKLTNLLNPSPAAAYGIIALDVNPAIELSFDRDLRVLAVRAVNPEGAYLLENIKQGTDLTAALAAALEKAMHHGYLDPDKEYNALMLTLVGGSETDSLLDNLETDLIDKLQSNNLKGYLLAHQSGWKERNRALKEGISLNRLLLKDILQTGDVSKPLLELLLEAVPVSNIRLHQIGSEQQKPIVPDPGKPKHNNKQTGQDNDGNPGYNSPIKGPLPLPNEGNDGSYEPGVERRP